MWKAGMMWSYSRYHGGGFRVWDGIGSWHHVRCIAFSRGENLRKLCLPIRALLEAINSLKCSLKQARAHWFRNLMVTCCHLLKSRSSFVNKNVATIDLYIIAYHNKCLFSLFIWFKLASYVTVIWIISFGRSIFVVMFELQVETLSLTLVVFAEQKRKDVYTTLYRNFYLIALWGVIERFSITCADPGH